MRIFFVTFLLTATVGLATQGSAEAVGRNETFTGRLHKSFELIGFRQWEKNYFLPAYHSFSKPYGSNIPDEVKSQISFAVPMLEDYFCEFCSIYFAYSQRLYFQLYNRKDSAPFRDFEINPQWYLVYARPLSVGVGEFNFLALGYNHTSNGERSYKITGDPRNTTRSKSLDRIMFSANYRYANFNALFRSWIITALFTDGKKDNGDIDEYVGYGDLALSYQLGRSLFELGIGNIINSPQNYARGYKGQLRLEYSLRITPIFSLFVHYLYGHGDSLYEYSLPVHRLGVGFTLF